MKTVSFLIVASIGLILLTTLATPSDAFSPLFGVHGATDSIGKSNVQTRLFISSNSNNNALKETLLEKIQQFRTLQQRDGDLAIDFGVKGGELNETFRAPQKVNYYDISNDVGQAADGVIHVCRKLANVPSPQEPTLYWGSKQNGTKSPLHGTWRLLFTTAADASFTSTNSTRGTATVSNVIDATCGKLTNVIQFHSNSESKPVVDCLNVVISGKADNAQRISLRFRYAKVLLNKFFFFPLFGKRLRLYIPVPGPFITRIIVFLSRFTKTLGSSKKRDVKKPPRAYFDVLYLDENLRIQQTGEDNIFVQVKDNMWEEAKPLLV